MHTFVDQKYLLDIFFRFVNTPSPVGYSVLMNPVIEREAERLGLSVSYDNRTNAYITLAGEDSSRTLLVNAHLDTLGLMVSYIERDGSLSLRSLGSPNLGSAESENVTVHTRDGRTYTGILLCKSHSTHAFDDARTRERKDDNMMVVLDERVESKEDTLSLGIRVGDIISIGDSKALYFCFPKEKGDIVAKTRLAAEELYKMLDRKKV